MSRTYRRAPRAAYRHPRNNGARRAVMETLDGDVVPATRPRAIPPDAWTDGRFSSNEVTSAVYRYLYNAWRDGNRFRRVVRRAQRRFGISYLTALDIMHAIVRQSNANSTAN